MAPEVVICETVKDSPYDYAADIWSLGQYTETRKAQIFTSFVFTFYSWIVNYNNFQDLLRYVMDMLHSFPESCFLGVIISLRLFVLNSFIFNTTGNIAEC